MPDKLENSLIRILDRHNQPVGAGFLISGSQAVTCAHVITSATGIEIDSKEIHQAEISLDFPLIAPNEIIVARVTAWHKEQDVALLELPRVLPPGTMPVNLIQPKNVWGHSFRAFGFPKNFAEGTWAAGKMMHRQAKGWIQIEGESTYRVEPGFSGGPVWDDELNGVVGMIVAADARPDYKSAFIIPSEIFLKHLSIQPKSSRVFICYKRHAQSDQQLASYLHTYLTARGHTVFIDKSMRTGEAWLQQIDEQIKGSDYLVVLLSKESADSEMVQAEVRRAYDYRKLQGAPQTLPVRVRYEGLLPYSIDAFVNPVQYVVWQSEEDNERIGQEIAAALEEALPPKEAVYLRSGVNLVNLSEDGRIISQDELISPPLPEFDPRSLDAPGGAVKLRDKLYIERDADEYLKREIIKMGTTTTIRAARQTGKSSLLIRGIHYAREQGAKVICLDVQRIDSDHLVTSDVFLRYFAEFIIRELHLDSSKIDQYWHGALGPQDNLTYLLEDYVLNKIEDQIVLAMDEIDRLLHTSFHKDFFALIRSWHNTRASDENWDKLNIVMVISTEPYLLIGETTQSPFNVGLNLYLEDFTDLQVHDLNYRHGLPVRQEEEPLIMNLLGGHPYLTRKALYTLATENIDLQKLIRAATNDHGPFGDHLRHHHWLLKDKPELIQALKDIIKKNSCPNEMAVFRLLRAGLIKASGDVCQCRCDLYRIYFEDKL